MTNDNTFDDNVKTTMNNGSRNKRKIQKAVIVVRHGERLDYVLRDKHGRNWIDEEKLKHSDVNMTRPWDPPLTKVGLQQAKELGFALFHEMRHEQELPPITAIYSSPFLRCRQTAAMIIEGSKQDEIVNGSKLMDINDDKTKTNTTTINPSSLKVRVEIGLSESINENWYRSWAIPGTDGTWGYQKGIAIEDIETLHPASKIPIVQSTVLNWKQCQIRALPTSTAEAVTEPSLQTSHNDDDIISDLMDHNYISKTSIGEDNDILYSLHPPTFESFKTQRKRMLQTMNHLMSNHQHKTGETIILVSHGGPVTHLYESLTGNHWNTHGTSQYCCFSVYVQEVNEDDKQENNNGNENDNNGTITADVSNDENNKKWTPLIVNRTLYDDPIDDDAAKTTSSSTMKTEKQASFQWS